MYKIKDSVNLKELEKFGYLEGRYMLYCSYGAYGKIYNEQLDNILEGNIKDTIYIIEINKKQRILNYIQQLWNCQGVFATTTKI